MRRVVVTGMGIACPLGLGVEHVWRRLMNGEVGDRRHPVLRRERSAGKVAGQVPPGAKADGKLDLAEWIPVKDQKKMDRFIHLAMVAGDRGGRGFRLAAGDRGGSLRHRRDDRLRHRRAADDLRGFAAGPRGQGPAALALLHPLRADQSRLRPCLDQIRLQGSEPLRRHRLRDRRARDRRRGAADHAAAMPT